MSRTDSSVPCLGSYMGLASVSHAYYCCTHIRHKKESFIYWLTVQSVALLLRINNVIFPSVPVSSVGTDPYNSKTRTAAARREKQQRDKRRSNREPNTNQPRNKHLARNLLGCFSPYLSVVEGALASQRPVKVVHSYRVGLLRGGAASAIALNLAEGEAHV